MEFVSATTLRVTVPPNATLTGFPDITLVDPVGGTWTSRGLLEVTDEIVLETFQRGDADGNGRWEPPGLASPLPETLTHPLQSP